jgi:phosphoglycerate dehydrogenase-like enzyme
MRRPLIRSVLVVSDLVEDYRERLARGFPDLRFHYATRLGEVGPALATAAPDAVLSMRHSGFQGPEHQLVAQHPSVRWVHVGGSGYEYVGRWDKDRTWLTNGTGLLARFLAETVTGALLAFNGNFLRYLDQQRARRWQPIGFRPLRDKTLLVVGLGAIGGYVAENAKALGMRVLAARRTLGPHPAVERLFPMTALHDALGEADFVSVHARLTEETRYLIDAAAFGAMKLGAYFINTSRGPVVEESALVAALESGHLAGAYLDVFETEPLPPSSPLWGMANVLITPHASDSVSDWPRRYVDFFAENLARWRDGRPLLNVVSEPRR